MGHFAEKSIILYAGPVWINATDKKLKRLGTIETNEYLIFDNKKIDISN